jgi:hypothetical protein
MVTANALRQHCWREFWKTREENRMAAKKKAKAKAKKKKKKR